jgi:CarD family transcriptional regulator
VHGSATAERAAVGTREDGLTGPREPPRGRSTKKKETKRAGERWLVDTMSRSLRSPLLVERGGLDVPEREARRAMGKGDDMQARSEIQFKVGDKAVYPAQGVAEVVNIEEKDIAGNRQRFYVLRILDTDRKIMVPVSNASAVGLRQVISEQEIREIFDILRERTIAFDNQTWNRRYRGFMDKIKTGSIYDVAEVLRDLYRLKTDKQLSFGERRMLDTARSLIVKEIAISRGQTEEQVKAEIEAIFMAN